MNTPTRTVRRGPRLAGTHNGAGHEDSLRDQRRCRWGALGDVPSADGAGDDELLDLLGALEDVVDLRVAVHALHRVLAGVAGATEDLDGPLGGPHRDAAGLELGHRALAGLERHTVATHPRGTPHEHAGGVDL